MTRESVAELNALPARQQKRPEVLQLRLHHLIEKERWPSALRISQQLCRVAPSSGTGFLHAAYCLHQLGKTAQARKLLVRGPLALLKEPIYYYNLGCYDALLGDLHDAREHLLISFRMDAKLRELARKDPDLEILHPVL